MGPDPKVRIATDETEDAMPKKASPDPEPPRRGGVRAGAGRPRRAEGARKVGVVLSPAAAAAWDAREGDRSAWVSALIERATADEGD